MHQLLAEMSPLTIALIGLAAITVGLICWGALKWLGPLEPAASPPVDAQAEANAVALLVVTATTTPTNT
jgi:hypothetical protein